MSELSRRDAFAAAALAGGLEQGVEHDMASFTGPDKDAWWHSPDKIARRAYAIADAMETIAKSKEKSRQFREGSFPVRVVY